jgi:hypothetical protein
MIVGIDNGLTGGIVALSPIAGLAPIAKFQMPTRSITYPARKTTKAKSTGEIDSRALIGILDSLNANREETIVYFEHCPFHADNSTTMRSMALSAGKILAILEAKSFKVVRILSYDWHPIILGKVPQGKTKEYAMAKARELWPDEEWFPSPRAGNPHDGTIDAALIAEYGRRIHFPAMVPTSTQPEELPWA